MSIVVAPTQISKTKDSRNSACPCGSGIKQKKCCLKSFQHVGIAYDVITANTELQWFTQVVDNLDLTKDCGNGPRHINSQYPKWSVGYDPNRKNGAIIDYLNELCEASRYGRPGMARLSEQWTKKKLVAHCAFEETWYFSAASYWKQRHALIMIDVDCKKRGTPEGARAFLEFLAANYFPGMYIEVSTNGNGGHGYLLIDKYNLEAQSVNDILLHRLCPWLNKMCQNFDVEFVEVKGTLPVVEWGNDGRVLRYTAGCPAKVPRGLFDHFDEIRRIPVVFVRDLKCLERIEKQDKLFVVEPSASSTTGKNFVELLPHCEAGGVYHTLAKELLAQKGVDHLNTSDRNIVTDYDLAVWLMLLQHCTETLDENGGLPTDRIKGLWLKLKQDDEITRAWNSRKHKAIRDFMSDLGLIAWVDESYQPGWFDGDVFKKGVCMKWSLSEELMQKLADVRDLPVKKEEERHALLIQHHQQIQDWVAELTLCDPSDQIRPFEIIQINALRYDPDTVTAYVGYFETMVA